MEEIGSPEPDEQLNSDFAWFKCYDKDIRTRVLVKQQAMDDSFEYGRQLCSELRARLGDIPSDDLEALDLLGSTSIQAWIEEMERLEKSSRDFEFLIGVAGATGAGKTSLLNALLEIPELLPSSSTEAATASVCRVAWNHDTRPGYEFQAEVVFCSRADVAKELDELLSSIKERKELNDQDYENEQEFQTAIEELNESISKGMDKFSRVWGFNEIEIEEELGSTSEAETIINMNPDLARRLGTTMLLHSSNAEEFAAEVKPFLDSTPTPQGYIAWPVIKEKLALTTIVTPAIRAVDEKTGTGLMSQYQELRMKLDGKFHKRGFCVVISKADDMDCDAYCKGPKEAKEDSELQKDVAEMKDIIVQSREKEKELKVEKRKYESVSLAWINGEKKLEKLRRRLDKGHNSSRDLKTRAKIAEQREKQTQLVADRTKHALDISSIEKSIAQIESHRLFVEGRIKYRYYQQGAGTNTPAQWMCFRGSSVTFSRRNIESVLESSHTKYKIKLDQELHRGVKEAKMLNPLCKKDEKVDACKRRSLQIVIRWVNKYPESAVLVKMSHMTYSAILRRDGGPYIGNAEGRPVYDFPQSLAAPLLENMLEDWLRVFEDDIPRVRDSIMKEIDEIWAQFIHEIKTQLGHVASSILPYFIHPVFISTLRTELREIFQAALEITGKGQFAKRQELILAETQRRNRQQFLAAYEKMEDRFLQNIAELPYYFSGVTDDAMTAVKTHIGMLLNNIQSMKTEDQAAVDMKIQLQKTVQSLTISWDAKWRVPQRDSISVGEDAFEIPRCYVEEADKLDDEGDIDMLTKEEQDDSDSDTESDGSD
ncbi:hypothetical protein B0T19DRAFT_472983 [Cercophora scortea]|uniref:Uncharacterized protein n=1 Tax=Cercophora scortea TaxID=314031 RepID=A0AAE0IVF8_9PEZI|nr:hypothetical protein B0T19DRAFT_472983 [Cercophora scortea]